MTEWLITEERFSMTVSEKIKKIVVLLKNVFTFAVY